MKKGLFAGCVAMLLCLSTISSHGLSFLGTISGNTDHAGGVDSDFATWLSSLANTTGYAASDLTLLGKTDDAGTIPGFNAAFDTYQGDVKDLDLIIDYSGSEKPVILAIKAGNTSYLYSFMNGTLHWPDAAAGTPKQGISHIAVWGAQQVPEGGATAVLLGLSMLALGVLRRTTVKC